MSRQHSKNPILNRGFAAPLALLLGSHLACKKNSSSDDSSDLTGPDKGPTLVVSGAQPVNGNPDINILTTGGGDSTTTLGGDVTPPTPGDDGLISTTTVGTNSIAFVWSPAKDDRVTGVVTYQAFSSLAPEIRTLPEIDENGTELSLNSATATEASVAGLVPATTYYFNVVAYDVLNNRASYHMLTQATDADTTPPTAGGSVIPPDTTLTINPSDVGSHRVTVRWNAATDNAYPAAALTYQVYYSTSGSLTSLEEVLANGTEVGTPQSEITSKSVSALDSSVEYYFNVIVTDPAGNQSIYARVSTLTGNDLESPEPGADGALTVSNVTATAMAVGWVAATDNLTIGPELSYRVFYAPGATSMESANDVADDDGEPLPGINAAGPWSLDATSGAIEGLAPGTSYKVVVIVRDRGYNLANYRAATQSTLADTTAPVPGSTGTLTITGLTDRSAVLTWLKATDNAWSPTTLTYALCRSSTNTVNTAAGCEAALETAWTADLDPTYTATSLLPSTTYYYNVLVKDGSGNKATYATATVTTEANTGAPTPGGSGILTTSSVSSTGMNLAWTAATDDYSPIGNLQYEVKYSTSNHLGTVATFNANGSVAQALTYNMTSHTLSGLTAGTTYYINVLVRDEHGNEAIYTSVSQTTDGAPQPGATGTITTSSIGTQGFTAAWTTATDDYTANGSLEYKVKYSTSNNLNTLSNFAANGTLVQDWTVNSSSRAISGLAPATTYYVNIAVRDAYGNTALYTTKSQSTAADTTTPTPGGSGVLTKSSITTSGMTVTWTEATDGITDQADLLYRVKYSTTNNLGSVANFNANGTLVLDWTASTDTAVLTGLAASTVYYLNVQVKDAAGNEAIYTSSSQITDGVPYPGASGTISTSNVATQSFDFSWTAASDDFTATNNLEYKVKYSTANNLATLATFAANGTLLVDWTASTTAASLTDLDPATTYYVNVAVRDATGNTALYVTKAQATTADTAAPAPGGLGTLTPSAVSTTGFTVSWTRASDAVTDQGDLEYRVKYSTANTLTSVSNFNSLGTVAQDWTQDSTSAAISGLNPSTTYYFNVEVRDAAGNEAIYTSGSQATGSDSTPPIVGGNLATNTVGSQTLTLTWNAASDASWGASVLTYRVYQSSTDDMASVAAVEAKTALNAATANITSFFVSGLDPATTYYFNVVVADPSGNQAIYTRVSATTATDSSPPSVADKTITTSSITTTGMTLTWNEGTDNIDAQTDLQYLVCRSTSNTLTDVGPCQAAVVSTWTADINSYNATGLTEGTTYYWNVLVKDSSNNATLYTSKTQATLSDTTAPTPGSSGTISTSSLTTTGVTLTWVAASDDTFNATALQYRVFKSSANDMGTVDATESRTAQNSFTTNITTLNVTGLAQNTTYYFNVVVKDGASTPNKAIYTTVQVTTPVDQAPISGNSGTMTSANVTMTSLTLNWTKATDTETAQASLQYKVKYSTSSNLNSVANFNANGTLLQDFVTDINTLPVAGLTQNTTYYFNVLVQDNVGNQSIYTTLPVTTVADQPPTPGNSGTLTTASLVTTGFTLNWTKATDIETAQASLQYKIKYSASNNLNSVSNFNANGTLVQDFTTDINTVGVTGLTQNTTYYVNVLVKDGIGNQSIYTTLSVTTPADQYPVPGNSGTITASGVGTTGLTLNWTKATDTETSQAALQYKIKYSSSNNLGSVANFNANGTLVQDFTTDINTIGVTGLSANTTYYFNVLVKDSFGNQTVYSTLTRATNTDVTAPTQGPPATLTYPSTGTTSITVNWTTGTDDTDASTALQYLACYSTVNDLTTPTACENKPIGAGYVTNTGSASIGGLTPATTYYFNVVAKDTAGNKALYTGSSKATNADVDPPTPGASGALTFNGQATTGLTVNWTRATDATYSQASLQYLVCKDTSNTLTTIAACEGKAVGSYTTDINSKALTGLSPGTTYYTNVVVKDGAATPNKALYTTGSTSTLVDTTPPTPGASGALTTANLTATSVDLNWTKGSDDSYASTTLQYLVKYSTSNNLTSVANFNANGTAVGTWQTDISTINISGLTAGTNYWLNVMIRDGAATPNTAIYTSASITTLTDITPPTPGASGNLNFNNITTTQVRVNWTTGSDNVPPNTALQYLVFYTDSPDIDSVTDAWANGTASGSYSTNISNKTVTGLLPGTIYYFNVLVKDQAGNEADYGMGTATTTADTTNPIPGGGTATLTVSNLATTSLDLNWTKATDDSYAQGDLEYLVCRNTSANLTTTANCEANVIATWTTDIATKSVTGLTPNTTYYFNVEVRDPSGNKALYTQLTQSSAVDSTPPTPGASGDVSVTPGSATANLTWSKGSDDSYSQAQLQYLVCKSTSNDVNTVAGCEAKPFGSYTTDIAATTVTGLSQATLYWFNVVIKDPASPTQNKAVYVAASATTSTDTSTPDTAANGATLSTSDVRAARVTLSWNKATDHNDASPDNALQYAVYRSTTNNIGTVANAETNGTLVQTWTTDIGSATDTSGLTPSTTYWFNVLVRDQALNKTAYTQKSVTTAADAAAPTPGGGLAVSAYAKTTMTVVWTKGSDNYPDGALATQLQYKVKYSTSNNLATLANFDAYGTLVVDWTADIATANVTGLLPSTTYYVNVKVKDTAGNEALYTTVSQRTISAVHLSYYDATNRRLRYGTDKTGAFVTEQVDTLGTYSQIQLATTGKPHIVYTRDNSASGPVYYANKESGSWATQSIDGTNSTFVDFVLDASNKVYAVNHHSASSTRDMYYSTNTSGSWVTTAIQTTNSVGQYAAIARDGAGKNHVAYYDATNTDIIYATNASGSWVATTVDGSGFSAGTYCDIAVDSANKAHIVYYDSTNSNLKYATNASGSWFTSNIDASASTLGQYAQVTRDAADFLHVVYTDNTGKDVKYSYRDPGTGTWNPPEIVINGTTANTFQWTAIDIGSDGKLHVAAYDGGSGIVTLKYVYGSTGSWSTPATVQAAGANVGKWARIVAE